MAPSAAKTSISLCSTWRIAPSSVTVGGEPARRGVRVILDPTRTPSPRKTRHSHHQCQRAGRRKRRRHSRPLVPDPWRAIPYQAGNDHSPERFWLTIGRRTSRAEPGRLQPRSQPGHRAAAHHCGRATAPTTSKTLWSNRASLGISTQPTSATTPTPSSCTTGSTG